MSSLENLFWNVASGKVVSVGPETMSLGLPEATKPRRSSLGPECQKQGLGTSSAPHFSGCCSQPFSGDTEGVIVCEPSDCQVRMQGPRGAVVFVLLKWYACEVMGKAGQLTF